MKNYFKNNVYYLRKKEGWSMQKLADTLDMKNRGHVNIYEKGVSYPSIPMLIKISNLFDVSVDDLLKSNLEEIYG